MVAIEAADLVFAVDSVPAVLAVSDNTFIIYASNAFAILGLRALYFLLAGMLKKFHYLGKGLAFILAFIGVKLFLQAGHKVISTSIPEIPSLVSLGVIVVALTVAIVASLMNPLPDDEDDLALEDGPRSDDGTALERGAHSRPAPRSTRTGSRRARRTAPTPARERAAGPTSTRHGAEQVLTSRRVHRCPTSTVGNGAPGRRSAVSLRRDARDAQRCRPQQRDRSPAEERGTLSAPPAPGGNDHDRGPRLSSSTSPWRITARGPATTSSWP